MIRPVGGLNEYRYVISDMKFTIKGSKDSPIILAQNIKSFSVLNQYMANIFPIIQVNASVEKDLYTLLSATGKEVSVQVIIHKYNRNSTVKARELVVSKVFSVFNESDLQASEIKVMTGDTKESDTVIKGTNTQQLMESSFYLIDKVSLNNYLKIKSLSLDSATLTDAIAVMFSSRGFKSLLMNKLSVESPHPIIIPTSNLLMGLEYVNNRYGIFNTPYIFYMDMFRSEDYLISKGGVGKAVRQGKPANVNMYLEEYSSVESADIGSIINNDAHVVNLTIPPVIQNLTDYTEYIGGSNVSGVDYHGTITKAVLDPDANSIPKNVMVYNKKVINQMQYDAKDAKQTVGVNLLNVDIDAIAPNLLYTITAHASFENLNHINAKYRLNEANISFTKESDVDFILRCAAIFVKIY
jgi:hypothetical protein